MHKLLCRSLDQEKARGPISMNPELRVEQWVQLLKSSMKYRATKFPGKVVVGDLSLDIALGTAKSKDTTLMTFDQVVPDYQAKARRGHHLDDGDEAGNICLGSGTSRTNPDEVANMRHALKCVLTERCPEGWDLTMVPFVDTLIYTYADLAHSELVYSK